MVDLPGAPGLDFETWDFSSTLAQIPHVLHMNFQPIGQRDSTEFMMHNSGGWNGYSANALDNLDCGPVQRQRQHDLGHSGDE